MPLTMCFVYVLVLFHFSEWNVPINTPTVPIERHIEFHSFEARHSFSEEKEFRSVLQLKHAIPYRIRSIVGKVIYQIKT